MISFLVLHLLLMGVIRAFADFKAPMGILLSRIILMRQKNLLWHV